MHATRLLTAPAQRPCQSDQGDWGGICPVCGQQLPPRPDPLQSWHARRSIDRVVSAKARTASLQTPLRHWHL